MVAERLCIYIGFHPLPISYMSRPPSPRSSRELGGVWARDYILQILGGAGAKEYFDQLIGSVGRGWVIRVGQVLFAQMLPHFLPW